MSPVTFAVKEVVDADLAHNIDRTSSESLQQSDNRLDRGVPRLRDNLYYATRIFDAAASIPVQPARDSGRKKLSG